MPHNVVSRTFEILNDRGKSIKGARLLVLGVTFKKDIGDMRESPSLELVHLLCERGADVMYNDPHVPRIPMGGGMLASTDLTREVLAGVDCVLIATDHSAYDYQFILDNASAVFDTRGVTRKFACRKNVFRLGERG
jgi:UDP-N-acetyl-D-glucosamine dehydrogenase